jgi:hypothetical protein
VDASSTKFVQYEIAMRYFVPCTWSENVAWNRTVHGLTPMAMDREGLLQSSGFSGGTNIEMLATSTSTSLILVVLLNMH